MSDNSQKKGLDSNVVAALIGTVGTIIVAVITILANRPSAPQPTPVPPTAVVYTDTAVPPTPVPTDTVPAGESTSTPEPATATPEPIPTPTIIPVGADWLQNCVSNLWMPYPSDIQVGSDDKGCLIQPIGKFYTSAGRLAFSVDGRFSSAQLYGVFAKLPSDGTVSVDVQLTTVKTGEVVMGIFSAPDFDSSGVIVLLPANNTVTKNQTMVMRTMPGQKPFSQTKDPLSADPAIYDAFFDFNSGNVRAKVGKGFIDLGSVSVVSGEKWLFLGYQVLNGTNDIRAEFLNLNIQAR